MLKKLREEHRLRQKKQEKLLKRKKDVFLSEHKRKQREGLKKKSVQHKKS